jgi:hypothetical protein
MTPNATLHHFTHPQWFDELGGFTKAENIPIFVNFAVKVRRIVMSPSNAWIACLLVLLLLLLLLLLPADSILLEANEGFKCLLLPLPLLSWQQLTALQLAYCAQAVQCASLVIVAAASSPGNSDCTVTCMPNTCRTQCAGWHLSHHTFLLCCCCSCRLWSCLVTSASCGPPSTNQR